MKHVLYALFVVSCLSASAQTIEWQKSFGGSGAETVSKIINTPDGGFLVGTITESNNGDVSGNHGATDIWLLKLDAAGQKQWQKCLGGLGTDAITGLENTVAGGYILTGTTASNGPKNSAQVFGNHGDLDVWVAKVDALGNIEWRKCYGGCSRDEARSVRQTSDGNYCVVGGTMSNNTGDVYGYHTDWDAWVLLIDPKGDMIWQKTIGGSGVDYLYDVAVANDGGFVLGGLSSSTDGDLSGIINKGGEDYWIAKLSASGDLLWSKSYGGSSNDGIRGMCLATDGSIVVTGLTFSQNGDVTSPHGGSDMWVLHLNANGGLLWQKTYGGAGADVAFTVFQRSDNDFITIGETASNDQDVMGNHGGRDIWVVKFDVNGVLKSQKCLGGSSDDIARAACKGAADAFTIGGWSSSFDGDVSQNFGLSDTWIVKMNLPLGLKPNISNPDGFGISVFPDPASDIVLVSTNMPGTKQITVFDLNGQLIQTLETEEFTKSLQIDPLPVGVYVLRMTSKNGVILTAKFVKN
jgi:hypothetical protein